MKFKITILEEAAFNVENYQIGTFPVVQVMDEGIETFMFRVESRVVVPVPSSNLK